MHLDFKGLSFSSEGDVETRLINPFMTGENYLGIYPSEIFSKDYFSPILVDKGSKSRGYTPDYSVWMHAFAVMIVEAKPPGSSVEQAYKEAALYAQQRNAGFPSNFNPSNFIFASNGTRILFGKWDSTPEIDIEVENIVPGSIVFEQIVAGYGRQPLLAFAEECLAKTQSDGAEKAFSRAGGQALLSSRKPLNSFAADLSPVLTRYFSSTESDVKEIARKAYVSSDEITEYDKILEALLQDRTVIRRDTIVEQLDISKSREARVERAIVSFATAKPKEGHLQIIQGSVGAGKSLFIRRFQQVLQSESMRARSRWAWINFNDGPANLGDARKWLCESFIESFVAENPEIDINSIDVLKGIFARQIQRRKPIYDEVLKGNPESAARMRGEDLAKWQDDSIEMARGIGNLVMGIRHEEVLITVLDNVDRLELQSQLDAFQLALWFMKETKCFVILQMRDETYERYKDKKPLDTFRTGIAFHISPPRFIDVVRRRLDLSIASLAQSSESMHNYILPSGMKINVPTTMVGSFLAELYGELFEKRRNVSRILESLAGLDVRRALDMFINIVTSGHLGEDQITSQMRGAGAFVITEQNILKILMRGQYRFFNDNSSFIINIFQMERSWKRPSNFLLGEILFFLARQRKEVGQIGIEGYFSVKHVSEILQHFGFDPQDTLTACEVLLNKYLIIADHMNNVSLKFDDSIKITASGYIHLRSLSERIEYIYGILPSTRIADSETVDVIVDVVKRENTAGDVGPPTKILVIRKFRDYLLRQANQQASLSGRRFISGDLNSGTSYLIRQISESIEKFYKRSVREDNVLD